MCELVGMRKSIEVRLGPGDRERLEAVIGSGNSPQQHDKNLLGANLLRIKLMVWRPKIIDLSTVNICKTIDCYLGTPDWICSIRESFGPQVIIESNYAANR